MLFPMVQVAKVSIPKLCNMNVGYWLLQSWNWTNKWVSKEVQIFYQIFKKICLTRKKIPLAHISFLYGYPSIRREVKKFIIASSGNFELSSKMSEKNFLSPLVVLYTLLLIIVSNITTCLDIAYIFISLLSINWNHYIFF